MRRLFDIRAKRAKDYESRDRIMARFAPTSLIALPGAWSIGVVVGFSAIYWAFDVRPIAMHSCSADRR